MCTRERIPGSTKTSDPGRGKKHRGGSSLGTKWVQSAYCRQWTQYQQNPKVGNMYSQRLNPACMQSRYLLIAGIKGRADPLMSDLECRSSFTRERISIASPNTAGCMRLFPCKINGISKTYCGKSGSPTVAVISGRKHSAICVIYARRDPSLVMKVMGPFDGCTSAGSRRSV